MGRTVKGGRAKVCRAKRTLKGKGVSPVVSTVIITAILLIILVIASFVSTNILEMQVTNTEFEQAKSNMLALNQVIQDVALRPGSGSYLQFNQRSGGIGVYQSTDEIQISTSAVEIVSGNLTIRPNDAGTYQNWTTFGGETSHWESTNDYPINDDTGVKVTGTENTNLIETEKLSDVTPSQNWTVDSIKGYFRAKASGASRGEYYPTRYTLLGSTEKYSGSLDDLKNSDNIYLIFKSYPSGVPENIVRDGNITQRSDLNWKYMDVQDANKETEGGFFPTSGTPNSLYVQMIRRKNTVGIGQVNQSFQISSVPTSATLYWRYRMGIEGNAGDAGWINASIFIENPDKTRLPIFNDSRYFSLSARGSNFTDWIYRSSPVNLNQLGTYNLQLIGNFTTGKDLTLTVYFDDIWLVIVPPENTCEVEFTGASNTAKWVNLTWRVDLAWTTNDVNTTIQVYNYTLGNYSTSGSGYYYNNSLPANNTQQVIQSITVNPKDFIDGSGNWKIKIKGVKSTNQAFYLNVDMIKMEVYYEGEVKAILVWKINGNLYNETEIGPISRTNFTNYNGTIMYKNPITGQEWNWTDLNDLEIGARATSLGEYETLQISEFWVEVTYLISQYETLYDSTWYGPLYNLIYRGGSRTATAGMELVGNSSTIVYMSGQLGYARIDVGDGARIILDYNRIRVSTNSILLVGNVSYNFTEVSFIRLEAGPLGGSGTINLKIQNERVNIITRSYDCDYLILYVRTSDHNLRPIYLVSEPGMKTAIIFTETVIRISMG